MRPTRAAAFAAASTMFPTRSGIAADLSDRLGQSLREGEVAAVEVQDPSEDPRVLDDELEAGGTPGAVTIPTQPGRTWCVKYMRCL